MPNKIHLEAAAQKFTEDTAKPPFLFDFRSCKRTRDCRQGAI